jgi:leucyl-tRNA synthetase
MILGEDGQKMSKSRGNVVNPDESSAPCTAPTPAPVRDVHRGPLEPTRCKPWVQVNGKVRGRIRVPAAADQATVLAAAKADAGVKLHLDGKTVRKEIVVPGKLINIVVG